MAPPEIDHPDDPLGRFFADDSLKHGSPLKPSLSKASGAEASVGRPLGEPSLASVGGKVMPTMVCVPCKRFFKVERNGISFEEGFGDGEKRPYKLWAADLYQCPGCGIRVIAGLGTKPIRIQHEPDYVTVRDDMKPGLFVDDCPGGCVDIHAPNYTRD